MLEHLSAIEREHPSDEMRDFNVALRVELRFVRTTAPDAVLIRVTNDPNAPAVQLSEEDIRQRWPWDYSKLCTELRGRYSDFLQNQKFHVIRKPLESDPRYCHSRFLDPGKQKGMKKLFYSANIVPCFDPHYTRKP